MDADVSPDHQELFWTSRLLLVLWDVTVFFLTPFSRLCFICCGLLLSPMVRGINPNSWEPVHKHYNTWIFIPPEYTGPPSCSPSLLISAAMIPISPPITEGLGSLSFPAIHTHYGHITSHPIPSLHWIYTTV